MFYFSYSVCLPYGGWYYVDGFLFSWAVKKCLRLGHQHVRKEIVSRKLDKHLSLAEFLKATWAMGKFGFWVLVNGVQISKIFGYIRGKSMGFVWEKSLDNPCREFCL